MTLTNDELLVVTRTATNNSNLSLSSFSEWSNNVIYLFGVMLCTAKGIKTSIPAIETQLKQAFNVSSLPMNIGSIVLIWDTKASAMLSEISKIARNIAPNTGGGASGGNGNPSTPDTSSTSPSSPISPGSLGFDCFVIIGQSNAEGNGKPKDERFDFQDPRIFNFSPGSEFQTYANKLIIAKERILNIQGELPTDDTVISFTTGFAKNYVAENPTRRVCLIGCALGNTGFSSNHWKVGDPLYNTTVEVCNRFLTLYPDSKIKGFLWHQGERDIDSSLDPVVYQTHLEAMIAGFRAAITGCANVPFVVGNYSPGWSIGFAIKAAYEKVNRDLTNRIDYTGNATSEGLSGNPGDDAIHFDARSQRLFSDRYYRQYKFALTNKLAVPPAPTNLLVSQLSATTLKLTFTQSVKAIYSIVEVRNGSTLLNSISVFDSKLVIPNLTANTSYNITVKSVNTIGTGSGTSITGTTNNVAGSNPPSTPLVNLRYEDSGDLKANNGSLTMFSDSTVRQVSNSIKGNVADFYQPSGFISYTQIPQNLSFATWVNLREYRPEATFFGCDAGGSAGRLNFGVNNASGLRLNVDGTDIYTATNNFPLNEWMFVGITYDNGVFKIFIDGERVSTINKVFSPASDNNPIWIGQKNFGYGSIRGLLNNTYLFDSSLTESQMLRLYELSF